MTYFNPTGGIIPPIYRETKKEENVASKVWHAFKIKYDNRHTNWSWRKKWLKAHPLKEWWELW